MLENSLMRIPYETCPLCGSADHARALSGDCGPHPLWKEPIPKHIHWHQCNACTHVFADGYFTKEALDILFSGTNEHQKVGAGFEGNRVASARIIERVTPHKKSGMWLDIGFGNASLLFTALEYGFQVAGSDLRADNVATLKQLGVEAWCEDVAALTCRADIISMCDVLEHMPFPKESLQHLHGLLHEDGLLLVSMPNMDSVVWKLLDANRQNPYWGELEHYHNFGRARLYALLEECGFKILSYGISERYRACMEVVARKI